MRAEFGMAEFREQSLMRDGSLAEQGAGLCFLLCTEVSERGWFGQEMHKISKEKRQERTEKKGDFPQAGGRRTEHCVCCGGGGLWCPRDAGEAICGLCSLRLDFPRHHKHPTCNCVCFALQWGYGDQE